MNTLNEKDLLNTLEGEGLEKDTLKKYAALITYLRANKLLIEKWWVKGQPKPDVFNVVGRIPATNLDLLGKLLGSKGLDYVKVFPKGIINPENFDIHMQFNPRQV